MSDLGMGAEVRMRLNGQSIGVGAVVEGDVGVAVEEARGWLVGPEGWRVWMATWVTQRLEGR